MLKSLARPCLASLALATCFAGSANGQAPSAAAPPAGGASAAAAPAAASGSSDLWVFENRSYFDPLVAEPRAAQITVLAATYAKEYQYQVKHGSRRIWDISLGKEIPIVGWESTRSGGNELEPGAFAFGVWIPVSFHMVEDFLDDSSPIINTDYRFGGQLKAQRAFEGQRSLSFKLQVGHESTHLGDEFTLHAVTTYPDFERINVSYEYWEYGIGFELLSEAMSLEWRFRHGGIQVLGDEGFYSDHLLEPNGREIATSRHNFEPSFGIEATPTQPRGWHPYGSVDLRLRTVYDYAKPTRETPEDRQWSVSAVLGLRNGAFKRTDRGIPDFVLRGYYGVNPNGQFRSQRSYWQIGVGIFVRV
jgi:hypothetical protein